jgi:hypothetical protein
MAVPAAGQVMVNASGLFDFITGGPLIQNTWCSISTGTAVETAHYMYLRTSGTNSLSNVSFAGTRVYAVTPGTFTVNLVCKATNKRLVPDGQHTDRAAHGPVRAQLTQVLGIYDRPDGTAARGGTRTRFHQPALAPLAIVITTSLDRDPRPHAFLPRMRT